MWKYTNGADSKRHNSHRSFHPQPHVAEPEQDITLRGAVKVLLLFLQKHCPRNNQPGPQLFIEFDEAHTLADDILEEDWTVFSELRRTLRRLIGESLFVLFLSTSSKIQLSTPFRFEDPSNRVHDVLLEPPPLTTALGFDLLARPLTEDKCNINYVVSDEWICNLGRPL